MHVGVVGLGYVGTPLAKAFAASLADQPVVVDLTGHLGEPSRTDVVYRGL